MTRLGDRRRLGAVALTLALLAGPGACSAPHSGATRRANPAPCAEVLPRAAAVAGRAGRLVVVRAISVAQLDDLAATERSAPLTTAEPVKGPICLVVYHGDYRAGDVAALPGGRGHYLWIVARVRPPGILWIALEDRQPDLRREAH